MTAKSNNGSLFSSVIAEPPASGWAILACEELSCTCTEGVEFEELEPL